MKEWTLNEGIEIVRAIQSKCRLFGYHVTIGGGVINNGISDKDIDLYFLPMGGFNKATAKHNPDEMLKWLEELWGPSEALAKDDYDSEKVEDNIFRIDKWITFTNGKLHVEPIKHESAHPLYKHAVKFLRNNEERIDCFIF